MKLLILGGTQFVGRHMTEVALARGHEVTLMHRGKTGADLFPEATHWLADRTLPLEPPVGGTWDAVLDVSGYLPRVVGHSCNALRPLAARYCFISTISVFDPAGQTTINEDSPLMVPPAPEVEEITGGTYGGLKVACEHVVREFWGASALIVRPGMVVGRYDHTDRFHHWVRQIRSENRVETPQRLDQPVQWIHAEDMARWVIESLESGRAGTFNAVGPAVGTTLGEMLGGIASKINPSVELVPVALDSLAKAPFALPEDGSADALFRTQSAAWAVGLNHRSLDEVVDDVVNDLDSMPKDPTT
ncbi:MAG: NAD-dependent epimerase/dehydratase family protein [Fimbriimonas sp.]